MRSVSPNLLTELIAPHSGLCVSLYMPVHSGPADGPSRAASVLQKIREASPSDAMFAKIRGALADPLFWTHPTPAVALFASNDYFETVELARLVPECVVTADSFHIKPLIRLLQTAGRYEVLCLTQHDVALYQGSREGLQPVRLGNVPRDIGDVIGLESDAPPAGAVPPQSRKAPGEKWRWIARDVDLDRYFRAVDRAIWETHSRDASLPIMLCAIEDYHPRFHAITKNPNVIKEGIKLSPDSLTPDRLSAEAWKIMQPYFHRQTATLIDRFRVARAHDVGTDQPDEVASAATQGRIDTLIVDANRQLRYDTRASVSDDFLDDAAETVLKTGGQVLVIPHELMPTDTGLAAIYRY
jgi:hypothetical protein